MERGQEKYLSSGSNTTNTTPSRPASRRTSTIITRESLPTPPPDPRVREAQENVFIYPPITKNFSSELQGLLKFGERQNEYQKLLRQSIASDCRKSHKNSTKEDSSTDEADRCECCEKLRKEFEYIMEPLQNRLNSNITNALAAYGAMDQLNRMYTMWEHYIIVEKELRQSKERLRYVNLLQRKMPQVIDEKNIKDRPATTTAPTSSSKDVDNKDIEKSIALLETILKPEQIAATKSQEIKVHRERSRSFMIEDIPSLREARESDKNNAVKQHLLRRQSTYGDSKSKVSKWTKVKAAFKWEKANVPVITEGTRDVLTPNNAEVARYLRVPSVPCGGSSADSILSSSSGHLLSEGTMSSASSMDDIDNNAQPNMRKDSSKNYVMNSAAEKKVAEETKTLDTSLPNESHKCVSPTKSTSNKSLRKYKTITDFEVVPEDVETDLSGTGKRKTRVPPRPLNLNIKQDLTDIDLNYYTTSPHLLKASPKDGTQSLNRTAVKKISSPVNSSVPSSPSRHSDCFIEFESEDLSSGDFSESNSPNDLMTRKSFEQQQLEINRRYELLRIKLDKEFEAKRKEWEKMKTSRGISLITANKTPEPLSPSPSMMSNNLTTKFLEENLTPDFKKKLQKWRVKKQASIGGIQSQATLHTTTPKENVTASATLTPTCVKENNNIKIDWNLWKTGQLKLEGQGLSPLPEQKDLPEEFQKKLEQWNKIKRGGSSTSCADSLKRSHKHGSGGSRKGESDDDKKAEKHKPPDKEKSERLAKLKAIVGDHPAKEIEVKTSAGVMKFEGISRKFTRKLYEWEKARGIGPEASTFALLHPGYCPIDVKRIPKETNAQENPPTLSRSLSLDSVAPSAAIPMISQQASSLSLNDVNDLKNIEEKGVNSTEVLTLGNEFKRFEEPEAVVVEVEDHIVETASALITANPWDKQQTPIYKYEEITCNDFCNTRRVQSFESHTNVTPLLNVLKNTEELLKLLKQKSPDIGENMILKQCESVVTLIRNSYTYYSENLTKPALVNAISDAQVKLSRLRDLSAKSPLDEACCQEIMKERNAEYNEEFHGLRECLEVLKHNLLGNGPLCSRDNVPDINITSEDGLESSVITQPGDTTCDQMSTTLEATDELSASVVENDTETPNVTVTRTGSGSGGGGKKKIRLRKVGSRQNSKTDSDSSDEDNNYGSNLETPRRLKRKSYRLKQRSFDDDPKLNADDMIYTLKVKPGQRIEENRESAPLKEPIRTAASLILPLTISTSLPNVFVKTKRKLFTTVQEPAAVDGLTVIEQEVDNSPVEQIQKNDLKLNAVTLEDNESKSDYWTYNAKIKQLEQQVKPRLLLVHKSLSLDDTRTDMETNDSNDKKSHSMENIRNKKLTKATRPPLANDSFRLINKIKGSHIEGKTKKINSANEKIEHVFKKHADKTHTRGITVKKIETKISKSQTANTVSTDKFDNTLPRIHRKWERKSLTPTTQYTKFNYPEPATSEPSSPMYAETYYKPATPLTERALRLKKAKEDFLKGFADFPSLQQAQPHKLETKQLSQWPEKGQSDLSLSSVTTTDERSLVDDESTEMEQEEIPKSLSANTLRDETPATHSDTGTDQDFGALYNSFPRQVTRSRKITSKLGFATLASKLRKVKGKKKPKNTSSETISNVPLTASNSNSALSTLCRQSLWSDVIAIPRLINSDDMTSPSTINKSKSSPHALQQARQNITEESKANVNIQNERLNKSQSEQYVKRHKESYV
ncbi:uncharacterized protein LOC119638831 isoform X4 [Glossina fuscipes]|uniref:Uncharacterized protein LOC119638831 isoform X4 n=1 Tax=Glossina fuscipes TaxID=7396 RepID=A0A9C6DUJ9_9MUSC|nr:uncharacterized protein LOC119638831 isoform X4 [Glossina fuscipes]